MNRILQYGLVVAATAVIAACGIAGGGGGIPFYAPAISITTSSLPAATAGSAYSQSLNADGGTTPYTWKVMSGTLPDGLTLGSAGVITGIPTTGGTSTFTVMASDSGIPAGDGQKTLTITVIAAGSPVTVSTGALPAATVGTVYSRTLVATGGTPPYLWSTMGGALPPGLALGADGLISGTPTTAGTYAVTFMVTDANPAQPMVHQPLTITVTTSGGPLSVATSALPAATVGMPYNQTLVPGGGIPPYEWDIMGGTLPPGLGLGIDGVITGTPTTPGTYNILFMVTDANPAQPMVHQPLTITVN